METHIPKLKTKNTRYDALKVVCIAFIIRLFNLFWMLLLFIIFLFFAIPMIIKPSLITKYRDLLDSGIL